MDLVERYLQAVKFWLPKRQKDDIIAELSEDIRAQIEDGEAALGRKFTSIEVEEILKQLGRPVLVANRYLPKEYLIGPMLFHVYCFVLKIVVLCYLTPWLLVSIGLLYSPAYSGRSWMDAFAGSLVLTSFVAIAVVTLVFAILERFAAKSHFLEVWNPRSLPAVRNSNLKTRTTSSFELAINAVVLVWWAANLYPTTIAIQSEVRIVLAPGWHWFFWGFLIVTLANCVLAAANLIRPSWTTTKAALRLAIDTVGSALFCWLMTVHIVASIAVTNLPVERATGITNAVNSWMERSFPIAVAVCVIILAVDVYGMVHGRNKAGKTGFLSYEVQSL